MQEKAGRSKNMVEDPYKVLGISRNASKEEIKKAYRQKAKQYHPDLHPNDAEAARKMNEVNEAYDMLNNPEKYKQAEQRNSSAYQGASGNSGWNGSDYRRQEYYGGFGQFGDFDFEDIFGFSGRNYDSVKPKVAPEDSMEIRQAINFINMGQYQYANNTLNGIVSSARNGRWYYLSALANRGIGNTMLASQQIDKAIQIEPNNLEYQKVRQTLHRTEYTYNEASQEFNKYAEGMNKICRGFCAMQFICMFCCH
jgi:molecular chaperone DnaJ